MQVQWKWWLQRSWTSSITAVLEDVGIRRGSLQRAHSDVLEEAMVVEMEFRDVKGRFCLGFGLVVDI